MCSNHFSISYRSAVAYINCSKTELATESLSGFNSKVDNELLFGLFISLVNDES